MPGSIYHIFCNIDFQPWSELFVRFSLHDLTQLGDRREWKKALIDEPYLRLLFRNTGVNAGFLKTAKISPNHKDRNNETFPVDRRGPFNQNNICKFSSKNILFMYFSKIFPKPVQHLFCMFAVLQYRAIALSKIVILAIPVLYFLPNITPNECSKFLLLDLDSIWASISILKFEKCCLM